MNYIKKKTRKNRKTRQIISFFMAVIMLVMSFQGIDVRAAADGVAHATDYFHIPQFTVRTFINTQTEDHYHATVILENIGENPIENWYLSFHTQDQIETIWDAEIVDRDDTTYTVKNDLDNQDIPVGGWVSFGYTASFEENIHKPHDVYMPIGIYAVDVNAVEISFKEKHKKSSEEIRDVLLLMSNQTDRCIEEWTVEFDLSAAEVEASNAQILGISGNHYIVGNALYNQNIPVEDVASFRITWKESDTGNNLMPQNVKVYSNGYVPENQDFASQTLEEENIDGIEEDIPTEEIVEDDSSDEVNYEESIQDDSNNVEETEQADLNNETIEQLSVSDGDVKKEDNIGEDDTEESEIKEDNTQIKEDTAEDSLTSETDTESVTNSEIQFICIPDDTQKEVTIIPWKIYEGLDSDGDEMPDSLEWEREWNLYDPDTDQDQLPDGFEWRIIQDYRKNTGYTSMLNVCPDDDYDQDGMSNLTEYQYGTDPILPDTDGDKVSDNDEVAFYGTNPLKSDTDKDGMRDGVEITMEFNPLSPDSDDNGIPDDQERIGQCINLKSSVSFGALPGTANIIDTQLIIVGCGDYEQRIELLDISTYESASDVYDQFEEEESLHARIRFETTNDDEVEFERAIIRFTYDAELVDEAVVDRTVIAQCDEEGVLRPLTTRADKEEHVISGEIGNLNDVVLIDSEEYYDSLNQAYLSQETISGEFGDNEYLILDEPLTWDEAQNYADQIGASVASIDSSEEKEFLDGFISEYGGQEQYWIGNSKGSTFSADNLSVWRNGSVVALDHVMDPTGRTEDGQYIYHVYYEQSGSGGTDHYTYRGTYISPLPLFIVNHTQGIDRNGAFSVFNEIYAYDKTGKRSCVTIRTQDEHMEWYGVKIHSHIWPLYPEKNYTEREVYLSQVKDYNPGYKRITVIGPAAQIPMRDYEYASKYMAGYTIYNSDIPTFSGIESMQDYYRNGGGSLKLNPEALREQQAKTGIVLKRKTDPNRKCWVYLLDKEKLVQLDRDPSYGNMEIDSDADGIPDVVELDDRKENVIPPENQVGLLKSESRVVQGWTCRSDPKVRDTDHDGLLDNNDIRVKDFDLRVENIVDQDGIKLNSGALYFYTGVNINDFIVKYESLEYSLTCSPQDAHIESSLKTNSMESFAPGEIAFLWTIDPNGVKYYVDKKDLDFKKKAYRAITHSEGSDEAAEFFFHVYSKNEATEEYFWKICEQLTLGKFCNEQTTFGTVAEIGISFTGVDAVQDIRDLGYDISTWFDADKDNVGLGEAAIDLIAIIPIIGTIKQFKKGKKVGALIESEAGEMVAVYKQTDNIIALRRLSNLEDLDRISDLTADVARSAKKKLKTVDAGFYNRVMNACELSDTYLKKFSAKGIYDNAVIDQILKYEDELTNLAEKNPKVFDEVVSEIAEKTCKNADISDQTVKELVEKGVKKADEGGAVTKKFTSWDDMKVAYKGIIKYLKEHKPFNSPNIQKWFKSGGEIEIESIDGKEIWTYISKEGERVPYVDRYVRFPKEYLYSSIPFIDIGKFSGDRGKDVKKFLEILEEQYGMTEIPKGYVVHHDIQNGILQLVDEKIHEKFTHLGGHSIYK